MLRHNRQVADISVTVIHESVSELSDTVTTSYFIFNSNFRYGSSSRRINIRQTILGRKWRIPGVHYQAIKALRGDQVRPSVTYYQLLNLMLDFHEIQFSSSLQTLSSKRGFRAKWLYYSHSLYKDTNEFLPVICIFLDPYCCNSLQHICM